METLTTLWPVDIDHPEGLVFHSSFGNRRVEDWHRRFLGAGGVG